MIVTPIMDPSIDREQEPDKTLVEPLLPPSESESTILVEVPRNFFQRLWDRRRRIRLEDVDTESAERGYLPKFKSWSRTKKIIVILLIVTILLVLCVVVPVVVVVTKHHRSVCNSPHLMSTLPEPNRTSALVCINQFIRHTKDA